jgi:hypothetical protein
MLDAISVIATLALMTLALAYVFSADRLKGRRP